MVSKVAVIALVAIVACPILLGYAMNLSEVTVTDYKGSGDSVNVTPLLQNDVIYTSIQGDIYQLNTNFIQYKIFDYSNDSTKILPKYESLTDTISSYPLRQLTYAPGSHAMEGQALSNYNYYYLQSTNEGSGGYLIVKLTDLDNNTYATLNHVTTFYYLKDIQTLYYSANGVYSSISVPDGYKINITDSGGYTGTCFIEWKRDGVDNSLKYVDLAAGFHFEGLTNADINFPGTTRTFLMTINLDSITDPNYSCDISLNYDYQPTVPIRLVKSTVGGEVSWKLYYGYSLSSSKDLYYDPSRNDNTYQMEVTVTSEPYSSTQERVTTDIDMKYIGGWPSAIGIANAYSTVSVQYGSIGYQSVKGIESIHFSNYTNNVTPTLRMDRSTIDGYEVQVISNKTYTPADFKTNPSTTISSVSMYGTSLVFGGNTYDVDNSGNITIGTHKVSVKGIMLESVLIAGGYENRINGVVVSTTAQPSEITFKGNWDASVSTQSMESTTYTKTEWTPGQFGWDGLDQNFLMVGLLTSIGVFIALGIYMRRTKAALWPLLIVCGGAAMLFFVML